MHLPAKDARRPPKLEEAGRILPQSLWKGASPADTLISVFCPTPQYLGSSPRKLTR